MQVEPASVPQGTTASESRRDAATQLTPREFRQLGVSRLAYVTGLIADEGAVNYIIHGADGIAVAVVDDVDLVVGLTAQLGLDLVTVH